MYIITSWLSPLLPHLVETYPDVQKILELNDKVSMIVWSISLIYLIKKNDRMTPEIITNTLALIGLGNIDLQLMFMPNNLDLFDQLFDAHQEKLKTEEPKIEIKKDN
jgi:hypothetical protein